MHPLDDTIAAVASPSGGAARGIVRISGPAALDCLTQFFKPNDGQAILPGATAYAVAGMLHLSGLHGSLPCDVYVWSEPAAKASRVRSYTGQTVAEIHTFGSPPLLQITLRAICSAGARLAEPGEFTLRAFLAGQIDLTQAEAVLGVIDAGDSHTLNVALEQLAGGLAHPLQQLRHSLLDLLACLEAGFDFADEDLEFITPAELDRRLVEAQNGIEAVLQQAASRGEAADSVVVVLTGRPNAGKSSLFNVLAGRRAALVSAQPGTTRDYLTTDLDLEGVQCRLVDTAGMAEERREERGEDIGTDAIERDAHSAAARQRRRAHVQVLCIEADRPLDAWEQNELANAAGRRQIVALTKCDDGRTARSVDAIELSTLPGKPEATLDRLTAFPTSSVTGFGIAELRNALRQHAQEAGSAGGDMVAGTALRCTESLRLADQCLQRARKVAPAGQEELAAAEVRTALDQLGKVTGAVYTEDVLDHIFSRFCVGK